MNSPDVVMAVGMVVLVAVAMVWAYARGRCDERKRWFRSPSTLYAGPLAKPQGRLGVIMLFLLCIPSVLAQSNRFAEIRTASGRSLVAVLVEEHGPTLARIRYIEGATRARATLVRPLLDPVSAELVFGPTNAVTNLTIRASAADVAKWERDTQPMLGRTADRAPTRNTHRGVRR